MNLSLLYTAKGASAFLVPVANMIKASTGSWHMVFAVTAIMNLVVVGLALFVLKPTRERIGLSTNSARPTTAKFMSAVTTNTACQLPVDDLIMLASGTRKAEAPFAV